jgi:Fe-S cluster assembly protein SufD
MDEGEEERLSVPQIIAALEDGARATLVERIRGSEEEGEVLVNDAADMFIGAGGLLDFLAFHDLNIDSSLFNNSTGRVERDAHLHHFVNLLGGMFSKVRTDVHLNGMGSDVRLDGLYFGYEDQHMDLRTVQYHKAKNANSRTFYKGAVKDESHSIYQGLIAVDYGCDQTDAYLTNNNLILNDGARADSIPTLQIHTDDVKASHGSTTGKIDQNQIFYLTSRGMPVAEAKLLIVEGFFEENIERAPEMLQEELRGRIAERMRAEQEED